MINFQFRLNKLITINVFRVNCNYYAALVTILFYSDIADCNFFTDVKLLVGH